LFAGSVQWPLCLTCLSFGMLGTIILILQGVKLDSFSVVGVWYWLMWNDLMQGRSIFWIQI
jgi:hypothetical protein